MKKMVFKLEHETYGNKYAPNCKVEIMNPEGLVDFLYNTDRIVGSYSNTEFNGELIFADITLQRPPSEMANVDMDKAEFWIRGQILSRNDKGWVNHFRLVGITLGV